MKDLMRKAYRVGTGEDIMAPPDTEGSTMRLAFDGRSAALVIVVLSLLCGLVVGWTASRPVEVHALTAQTLHDEEAPPTEPPTAPESSPPNSGEPGSGQTESSEPESGAPDENLSAGTGTVTVYVSGHVHEPGLVELPEGSRAALAIEQVGGMTAEADPNSLNLARILSDGEHIIVPAPGEAVTMPAEQSSAVDPGEAAAPGLVNINTASMTELETLPGVGPVMAQRIIDWREMHPFTSIDELMEVSGIGPATFQRLRDLVTV